MSLLPSMDAFLEGLPQGLGSYPQHLQRASVFRVFTEGAPLRSHVHTLPAVLQPLVTSPPLHSAWMTEVEATAVYLAMMDLCFDGEDAFVRYALEANRRLLHGPLYRALHWLVGPDRVVSRAGHTFGQMHRGLTLEARMGSLPRSARFTLTFPPGLMPRVIARCYVTAVQAAVETAGGRDVVFDLILTTPTSCSVAGSWS